MKIGQKMEQKTKNQLFKWNANAQIFCSTKESDIWPKGRVWKVLSAEMIAGVRLSCLFGCQGRVGNWECKK